MPRLAIYLLGPPRVELDGETVHIPRRKALALLAYLAVERQAHRRDSLVALLWPEYDQSSARADLRRTLSILNRTLGQGWLVADRETVELQAQLDGTEQVFCLDVEGYRQRLAACQAHAHPPNEPNEPCEACIPLLEEAVALYRGSFMSGFALRDSLAFDEWQFFQTERLKDQLASALDRLVRWYEGREEYDRAIAHARRRLEQDTLDEAAHQELMELFALAGQQTAALRQYELCKQTLAEELGVSPSAETTALYERIRAGEDIGREPELVIPHNLPPQSTPFIGRERELAYLSELLASPDTRLVTILGPGGVGKTRLALASAEEQLRTTIRVDGDDEPRFSNGVFFVPLARLSSANQIVPNVAEALGLRPEGRERGSSAAEQHVIKTRTVEKQVLDYLREKRMLLVFDNYEHLMDAVGFVAKVLHIASDIRVLTTSREKLLLHEEQAFPIQGLDFPDEERPDEKAEYSAVQLFLQCARRVQPDFELSGEDFTHLARVCCLLEGLPLGIELAAGWVDILSLTDIAVEIQQDLGFLETHWRDVPERHRSMRAVFDTSWRCLSERERDVSAQLCVFRGGFTRIAAQEVAGADLRDLASLVNRSLLNYNKTEDRYDFHNLLHQYGAERLAQDTQREAAVRDRHSTYYCAELERWEAELFSSGQLRALEEIAAEFENVRAAWEWAAAHGHVTRLDQAMDSLCGFLSMRARIQEGELACKLAYEGLARSRTATSADAQRVLAKALFWRSEFNATMGSWELAQKLLQQGQALLESPALVDCDTRSERAQLHGMLAWAAVPSWGTARKHLVERLALLRELGYEWSMARTLLDLGDVESFSGEDDRAKQGYQESLRLYHTLGDHSGVVMALISLGYATRATGAYDDAWRKFNEALGLARAHSDLGRAAIALVHLGWLALFLGDFRAGTGYLRESVTLFRDTGDRKRVAQALVNLSMANWYSGEVDKAHLQVEEALVIFEDMQFKDDWGNAMAHRALMDANAGRYDVARTYAAKYLADHPAGIPFGYNAAIVNGALGWTALAEGDFAGAKQPMRQAIIDLQQTHQVESREYTAWSLAAMGRAEYGLGNSPKAREHLLEALRICVDIRAFIPLLHLMPIIPVVLADEDDARLKERAVELYALATSHPFVTKAQLFEDIAGRYIRAATASLAPDVVAAAQERGRALDWWETAEALLPELN